MKNNIVVFDGTSAYVIPKSDLQQERKVNNVKVVGSFETLEQASRFCDAFNDEV